MKTYEITFITKEDVKEKPIKDILTGLDGKVLNTSSIGEKQFTYPIKKESRGFYTTVLFELAPEKLSEFNKKFSLNEEILRFLMVAKKPSEITTAAEIKALPKIEPKVEEPKGATEPHGATEYQEKEITPAIAEKPKVKEPVKVKKEVIKPEKTIVKKEPKVKVEKKEEVKISPEVSEIEAETVSEEDRLKALDKKLDELLKE